MTVPKYRTFAITLRPRSGVTDEQVTKMHAYCEKRGDFYVGAIEMEGTSRHIHVGLFTKKALRRANVVTELLRIYKDLDEEEKTVFRKGIKVMYNKDWIQEYMAKEGNEPAFMKRPEGAFIDAYFPEPDEVRGINAPRAIDPKYANLERLYRVHGAPHMEPSPRYMRDFLFELMFEKRIIKVIESDKKIIETAKALSRYVKRLSDSPIELPPYEKDE